MAGGDLYSVLGVPAEATGPEIQAAYQRLGQQLASGEIPPGQKAAIDEAYNTLGDPIRRLRYDAQLAAPPPPRFQMPTVSLPGRNLNVPTPRVRALPLGNVRRIDPLVGAAIVVVLALAAFILILLVRGGEKPSSPAESVADLVPTATAPAAATPATQALAPRAAATPFPGLGPGPFGVPGSAPSLVPLAPPGVTGGAGPFAPPPGGSPQGAEPPFLTSSALVDMLRAVIAASAVRNGPGQGTAAAPPSTSPAGVTSANVGALPPVVTGSFPPVGSAAIQPPVGQPGAAPGAGTALVSPGEAPTTVSVPPPELPTPPPPTATRAPNHITVPTTPIARLGSAPQSLAPTRSAGATTPGPNRFGPVPTPSR